MKPYVASHGRQLGTLAVALAALAATGVASAQVTFFGAQKTAFYSQIADNSAPTIPVNYSEFAFVNTTSAGDADGFTLSSNATAATIAITGTGTSFGGDMFYPSATALNADFPPNSQYVITAQGGTLDGDEAFLPVDPDAYPAIVYLTGTSFSDAMHVSPTGGFTFDLGYSGDNSDATNVNFDLLDSTGDDVFHENLSAGTTSIGLSQSEIDSLTPGETYTAAISNFSVETGLDEEDDFAGANFSYGFVNTSDFDFFVEAPEPASTALMLVGLLGLAVVVRFRAARTKA